MSAYVIIYLRAIKDAGALARYRELAAKALSNSGATIRIRSGQCEVLEGEPVLHAVMLEFPSLEAAKRWYASPEYQAALPHRLAGADSHAILVEGI
jgi:uncharacterized protein (DUF1330 family)